MLKTMASKLHDYASLPVISSEPRFFGGSYTLHSPQIFLDRFLISRANSSFCSFQGLFDYYYLLF